MIMMAMVRWGGGCTEYHDPRFMFEEIFAFLEILVFLSFLIKCEELLLLVFLCKNLLGNTSSIYCRSAVSEGYAVL